MRVNLILPCGGSGSRAAQGKNKLLSTIGNQPLIIKTINQFIGISAIVRIILPCSSHDLPIFQALLSGYDSELIVFCLGGDTRSQSVKNALELVNKDCEVTLIHDGARPFVSSCIIDECIEIAFEKGSAITAIPMTDTLVHGDDEVITDYIPRENVYRIQTPQGFRTEEILRAYAQIGDKSYTDDSSVYLEYIGKPTLIHGSGENIKITYPEDFRRYSNTLVGCGYDTHALAPGRKLILGGVEIPHNKGLLGHSDADALVHAIMDALLTACNQRDIGVLFPDTDPQYKDISSIILLKNVNGLIRADGYDIINISAVIMAQKPKLMQYIPDMIKTMSEALAINCGQLAISATTTEGLGFIGREEGIAARAICSVVKRTMD